MNLITVSQAATKCAISSRMIRKLITMRELPAVRVGRCVRLRDDDVEALIRRGYSGQSSHNEHLLDQQASSSLTDDSGLPKETTVLKGGRNALG
jgi:excisionase family DNA binding protein